MDGKDWGAMGAVGAGAGGAAGAEAGAGGAATSAASATSAPPTATENRADQTLAEAALLELFAQLLHRPATGDDLAFFTSVDLDDPHDIACADARLREGLRLMQSFCQQAGGQTGEDGAAEDLRMAASNDFHKMFVGPGRKTCPPWGSVYLDGKRLVNGPSEQRVRAALRAGGLAVAPERHEPWDHVAYELHFVAHLWQQAADAARCGHAEAASEALGRARAFVDGLLAPWAAEFFATMEDAARTDFYRGLARAARRSVELAQGAWPALEPLRETAAA